MIRRAALVFLLASAPAIAQDAVWFSGTGCQIVPVSGEAHVAEIHCRNRITSYLGTEHGRIEAGGVGVEFTVENTSEPVIGQAPDIFAFEPDPGFWVEPIELVIDEHSTGVALVFVWSGS